MRIAWCIGPALAVLSLSCGGGQKTSSEPGSGTAPAAPAEAAASAGAPAGQKDGPPAEVAEVDEDWKRRAELIMTMFGAMARAAADHPTDCDGFAGALDEIVAVSGEAIAAGRSMQTDPAFKEWFETTYDKRVESDLAPMITRMLECKGNEKLARVLEKLDG